MLINNLSQTQIFTLGTNEILILGIYTFLFIK